MVEPELLKGPADDPGSTVHQFIVSYAGAAQEVMLERSKSWLPICEYEEGLYLALLVRLCMTVPDQEIRNVADIYDQTLTGLLQRSGSPERERVALRGEIEDLCVETYWTARTRILRLKYENQARADAIRAFRSAGIIVSAERRAVLVTDEPRKGRFFHDSMLSYLTACGLARAKNWDALPRAAGDPAFSREGVEGGVQILDLDLFPMCINVFDPSELRIYLRAALRQWAASYRAAFSIEQVESALFEDARREVANSREGDLATYLRAAIDVASRRDEKEEGARALGALYWRLAPTVWHRLEQERQSAA